MVTKDENHKKRLVIDYSQRVNKFTLLDAYTLPNMDNFINKIAQYKVFTSVDLKSAYHLKSADRPYTAFEGDGQLVQFTRMPFGVTNGIPCFQRKNDKSTIFCCFSNKRASYFYFTCSKLFTLHSQYFQNINILKKLLGVTRPLDHLS